MAATYKFIFAFLLCLTGFGAQCQNSYLLNFEHKESRKSQNLFFYMEALAPGTLHDGPDVVSVEDAVYRVHFLRLSEPSASSYMGCIKFSSQAAGETLSVRDLLSDSVLTSYGRKQQAIEDECMSLLDNRGRQNTVYTIRLNNEDRIRMVPVQLDLCTCKASGEPFSMVSDTLAMVRNIGRISTFTEAEKVYWKDHIAYVLDNEFVNSCLPQPDRFARVYQARRD